MVIRLISLIVHVAHHWHLRSLRELEDSALSIFHSSINLNSTVLCLFSQDSALSRLQTSCNNSSKAS